jgi:hypothetical protein
MSTTTPTGVQGITEADIANTCPPAPASLSATPSCSPSCSSPIRGRAVVPRRNGGNAADKIKGFERQLIDMDPERPGERGHRRQLHRWTRRMLTANAADLPDAGARARSRVRIPQAAIRVWGAPRRSPRLPARGVDDDVRASLARYRRNAGFAAVRRDEPARRCRSP